MKSKFRLLIVGVHYVFVSAIVVTLSRPLIMITTTAVIMIVLMIV